MILSTRQYSSADCRHHQHLDQNGLPAMNDCINHLGGGGNNRASKSRSPFDSASTSNSCSENDHNNNNNNDDDDDDNKNYNKLINGYATTNLDSEYIKTNIINNNHHHHNNWPSFSNNDKIIDTNKVKLTNGFSSMSLRDQQHRPPLVSFNNKQPKICNIDQHQQQPNFTNGNTQTLNRLEFSQRHHKPSRVKQIPANYQTTKNRHQISTSGPAEPVYWRPEDSLTVNDGGRHHQDFHIYAPASIAGCQPSGYMTPSSSRIKSSHSWFPPVRKFMMKKDQQLNGQNGIANEQQQLLNNKNIMQSEHYAASSLCRRPPSAQSIGRESSLGSIFGSLRRRRRDWFGSLRRRNHNKNRKAASVCGATTNINGQPIYANTLDGRQVEMIDFEAPVGLDLDEIYAKGRNGELKAEHIYAEGTRAIDGNSISRSKSPSAAMRNRLDIASTLADGETKWIILDEEQTDYLHLIGVLRNWINDLLASERIIVMDLQEDLYDGQIFAKLLEKLSRLKLDLIEVTQNEDLQKQRLAVVLNQVNRIIALNARWARVAWSVNGIHSKFMPEILHLLVFLAIYYRAPMKLPPNVMIRAVEISKLNGHVKHRSHQIQLTKNFETSLDGDYHEDFNNKKIDNLGQSRAMATRSSIGARDAFDELVDKSDIHLEKLNQVSKILIRFANRHLNKLNMSCNSINLYASPNRTKTDILNPDQFTDGLLLVFLIASLENYFVPLGNLFTTLLSTSQTSNNNDDEQTTTTGANSQIDKTTIQVDSYTNTHPLSKLHNVNFALDLMDEAGIEDVRKMVRAEEIVSGDLKAILRILYVLFSHYKHL